LFSMPTCRIVIKTSRRWEFIPMGIRAIPIFMQVVSHSVSFPFPILSSISIPMGFQFPFGIPFTWSSLVQTAIRIQVPFGRYTHGVYSNDIGPYCVRCDFLIFRKGAIWGRTPSQNMELQFACWRLANTNEERFRFCHFFCFCYVGPSW